MVSKDTTNPIMSYTHDNDKAKPRIKIKDRNETLNKSIVTGDISTNPSLRILVVVIPQTRFPLFTKSMGAPYIIRTNQVQEHITHTHISQRYKSRD